MHHRRIVLGGVILFCFIMSILQFIRLTQTPVLGGYETYDLLVSYPQVHLQWLRFFAFICGALLLLMVMYFHHATNSTELVHMTSTIYVLSSPVLIYYALHPSVFALSLCIMLLGFVLLINEHHFFAIVLYTLSGIVYPNILFILIICLLFFVEHQKKKNSSWYAIFMFVTTFIFIKQNSSRFLGSSLISYINELTTFPGISLFGYIIALAGIYHAWQKKNKYGLIFAALICILSMSLFNRSYLIMVELLFAFFAGIGMQFLFQHKWSSDTLKQYVIMLFACGIIFSFGLSIQHIITERPGSEEYTSMIWLQNQEEGTVLSDYTYGSFISYIAKKEVFIDSDYVQTTKTGLKLQEMQSIFLSRNLQEILVFMTNYEIKYIVIFPSMQDATANLQFILEHSKEFKRVFWYDDLEIFMFLEQE